MYVYINMHTPSSPKDFDSELPYGDTIDGKVGNVSTLPWLTVRFWTTFTHIFHYCLIYDYGYTHIPSIT